MTERLGQAKSPLTVDELLEALEDPRFNVRFEAIISIARMMPDPRLIAALENILGGSELALTVVAAWALGRLGDKSATGALRHALDSEYRSVRAHSARALGALKDHEVAPMLLSRLQTEGDKGLLMAYASAMGNLGYAKATPELLKLLAVTENKGARLELALTLARIVGDEYTFIQLLRNVRSDPGTAMAQSISAFKRRLGRRQQVSEISQRMNECAEELARGNLEQGEELLALALQSLPKSAFSEAGALILAECASRLEESGTQQEYVILALHVLQVDWDPERRPEHYPTHH
jgi:HEAT repeat protein